jgi:hypothetical protein
MLSQDITTSLNLQCGQPPTTFELHDRFQVAEKGISQDYINAFVAIQSVLALSIAMPEPQAQHYRNRFSEKLQNFPKYSEYLVRKATEIYGDQSQSVAKGVLEFAEPKRINQLDGIVDLYRRVGQEIASSSTASEREQVMSKAHDVFWLGYRLAVLLIQGEKMFGTRYATLLTELSQESRNDFLHRRAA